MQRKRDSDSSRHLEPVRKLSQQLAKVEATPTPPQQHVEKRNDKIQLQAEVAQLCEQLEEARRKIKAQGQVATAVQKRFKDCLGQIQAGTLDKAQMTEDQNKKLAARNAELLELLQVERAERESTLCCLQRALAETQRDLGTCEGALEARVRECDVTDQEKRREQERAAWLEGRLRESEDENAQLRESFHSLRVSLHYKDGEAATSPQRSLEAESQTPNIEETEIVLKLVESVRQLQADNARLEEALKRQTDAVAELQEAQEAQLKRAVLEQQLVQEAQLERAEEEAAVLRGHLQEARTRAEDRERESADLQRCFGDAFGKIRAEAAKIAASNQQLQELLEIEKAERKREMSAREQEISEREQEIAEREQERSKIESYVLQLQQELAEAKREALLYAAPSPGGSPEDYSKLEEEKLDLHRYIGRLEGTLKESEVKCVQSEQLISKLVGSLREKDHEVAASSQKLQEVFAASASMDRTIQLLRDSVLRLETDTLRQEEAAKEQAGRIAELETEVDDAMIAKRDLEERLSQEMQKQSSFSVNAQVELNEAEAALQAERKKSSEAQELQKDLQEQLEQGQRERLMLQQQLEDSQKRTELKDQALKDMQDFICDTTRRLSQVNEQLVEEKSTDVVGLENVEDIDTGQDSILRQLQNILAKMQTKLSSCEQSLEEKTLCCKDLALKNQCMLEDVDRLQRMLQQSEDKLIQAESRNVHLQRSMDSDKEVIAFLQKSKEVVSVSTDTAETMESLGQLKTENMILEETLRQQASRIVELEREVDEAAEVKKYLEERLDQEIERQNSLIANTQVEVSDAEVAQPDQGQKSNKAQKQQVDLQAQLDSAKTDRLTLRKHLREAQKISELRDLAVMDMQRCMNDTLTGMRAYSQERIELAERRSTVFASEIAELQEQLERVETDRDGIQKELAEARRKLSSHEESLEEKTSGRRDIEERPVTQGDVTALKDVLQRTDDKNVKLGRDNFNLKCALKDKELKVLALSQKLRESASAADSDRATQVESLRLLESENLRLEEALKQQTGRIAELEKEVAEAAGVKRDLEEQLSRDVERRGSLSIDTRVAASGGTVVALQNEQGRFGAAEKPQEEEQVKILQQQLNEAEEMTELEDPELQEQLEPVITDRDGTPSQTQKELADVRQKLSSCEEALEDKTLRCRDLEEEKLLMREDLGTLKEVLEQTDDKYVQLERYSFNLKCALENKEREAIAIAELRGNKDADSESLLRDLRKEVAEMQDKLSSCEESLEVKIRSCRELEDENLYVKEDLNILRGILQEAEERYMQSEHYNFSLKCALEDKEREVMALTPKFQEVASASTDLDETVTPVDGSLQRWGSEETERDSPLRPPSKLADVQTKLSLCEEMLEEAARRCRDLEEEKLGLEKDTDALRRMLQESEEKQFRLERRTFDLECALDAKGGAVVSQGLGEFLDDERAPVRGGGLEERSLTEASQERAKGKAVPLYRQLEAVEESEEVEQQVRRGVEYPFSSTPADSPPDYSKRTSPMEEAGNRPASVDTDLQRILEPETPERERDVSQPPRELAGALELLEMKVQTCRNLEEQLDMLRKMLEASERQNVRLEICVQNLRGALDSGECKVIATALKLHQALMSLSAAEKTIVQLEDSARRLEESARGLEAENGELKAKARRQADEVGGTEMEPSQLEDWVRREVRKQTSMARKEVLRARLEKEKALAQMKAEMEQMSLRLQEEVGRSSCLEEEEDEVFTTLTEQLSSLSDSFEPMNSRSRVEREVASRRF